MSETTTDLTLQKALADRIEAILEERNAQDIERIAVDPRPAMADFFILATARSATHLKALADEVEFQLKQDEGMQPHHIEGMDSKSWILLDYGDIVVHLFLADERSYYNLEKLWSGRRREDSPEALSAN